MDAFVMTRISSVSTASTSYRLKGSELWSTRNWDESPGRGRRCLEFRKLQLATRSSIHEATKADDVAINGTRRECSDLGKDGESVCFNALLAAIASLLVASPRHNLVLESPKPGRLLECRLVYRQTFVIRSYEVGVDKTASIETLMNHFQETALNHVWMSGLAGEGFGATHAMIRHDLIWVVSRVHVQVERYASWGDAIEIDTWVDASGKNGMRRDWLVRDYKSGRIAARATSTWVVMNRLTRRLAKMPEDVRDEITPFYFPSFAFVKNASRKIPKFDCATQFVRSNLTPRHGDLDMNQHVNNVKYVGWMLESVPLSVVQEHDLLSLTLEYRRECGQSDIVQSMTWVEHTDCSIAEQQHQLRSKGEFDGIGIDTRQISLVHLLRMQCDGSELVRGKTVWQKKRKKKAT